MVWEEVPRQESGESFGLDMVSKPMKRSKVGLHIPGVHNAIERSGLQQLSDMKKERYFVDNEEQCEEWLESCSISWARDILTMTV